MATHRVWYGMDELSAAIAELMTALNNRVMRRFGRSRRELFEEPDRPLLKPLPAEPYVLAEWRRCKVGLDYHVEVARHFYSVPHRHARAQVEVRLTARTVEVFLKGERIASHMRGSGNGRHTTVSDHMPSRAIAATAIGRSTGCWRKQDGSVRRSGCCAR